MLNKVQFKFPILLTFIHYIVSWFFMAILNAFSVLPAPPSSKLTRSSTLIALGTVMALSTGLANVSLKYNRYVISYFYDLYCVPVTQSLIPVFSV